MGWASNKGQGDDQAIRVETVLTDHLSVKLSELGKRIVEGKDLRRADEREVHRVEKENEPEEKTTFGLSGCAGWKWATRTICRGSPGA